MTPYIIFTRGVSASGKSTWAYNEILWYAAQGIEVTELNRDTVRWELMQARGVDPCWANWNWKHERLVTEILEERAQDAIIIGRNIIDSNTNLNVGRLDEAISSYVEAGYEASIKGFDVTWDMAIRRDNARANGVGYSVLAKQFEQLYHQPLLHNDGPTAVMIDLDGTIADMAGIRRPYEWHRVGEDTVHEEVADVVFGLIGRGYYPIFVSGRDGVCRPDTIAWIRDQLGIERFRLYMRPASDTRSDETVKEEIFNDFIRDDFNVKLVIDDRPRVCRMWRRLGLKVMQVGNPYVEF